MSSFRINKGDEPHGMQKRDRRLAASYYSILTREPLGGASSDTPGCLEDEHYNRCHVFGFCSVKRVGGLTAARVACCCASERKRSTFLMLSIPLCQDETRSPDDSKLSKPTYIHVTSLLTAAAGPVSLLSAWFRIPVPSETKSSNFKVLELEFQNGVP